MKKKDGKAPHIAERIPLLQKIESNTPYFWNKNIEKYVSFDAHATTGIFFALRMPDNGLNVMGICKDDLLIVQNRQRVEEGDIAAVLVDEKDVYIRFWSKRDRYMVSLRPKSSCIAYDILLYDTRITSIRILGRVIECRKFFV